jgi:uncharacterized membrane protein
VLKDSAFLRIGIMLMLAMAGVEAGRDPETGRIRVLYVGDMIRPSPYPIMEAEPLIDVRVAWPVGGDLTQQSLPFAKKLLRQYIPRTYDTLAANDVIVIDNPEVTIFEPRYLVWFRDAVILNGSGLFMVGGNAAFGGRPSPSWGPTPVQEVLPVWVVEFGWLEYGSLAVLDPDHDFVSSLPLQRRWEWTEVLGGNEVVVKRGARQLAEYRDAMGRWTNPFWVTWDVGEGRSFAQTVDWTPAGGWLLMRWEYYPDYVINLMTYTSKNQIPPDADLMHKLRGMYLEYRSTKAYVYSVMDFAERLGANTNTVNDIIRQADMDHKTSIDRYIGYDFQAADGLLESSITELRRASSVAFRLKDQAMLWIFLIEWSVVTATLSLAGFAIWTLMVRRRLYREVSYTRFA